jgi:protoheme IX farnesyltransferase
MPHFLAITLFRQADFARAGIRCVPVVRGEFVTRVQAILWSILLVPISLLPTVIGLTGWLYGATALLLSLGFLASRLHRPRRTGNNFATPRRRTRWARASSSPR